MNNRYIYIYIIIKLYTKIIIQHSKNYLDKVFTTKIVITWLFDAMAESMHTNKIQISYINLKSNDNYLYCIQKSVN